MSTKIWVMSLIFFAAVLCRTSQGLGSWVSTVLDIPAGISGIYPNYGGTSDVAVDSSGNVHISHSDHANGQVRYVTNASGAWAGKAICNFTLSYTTITFDSKNRVHIYAIRKSAGSSVELIHATIVSGTWHVTSNVIDATPVSFVRTSNESIYLDASDNLHIVYVIEDSSYDEVMRYATNASGNWTVNDIYNAGYRNISSPSIVSDSARNVHIAFAVNATSLNNYVLKYATNASGVFQLTDVCQSAIELFSPSIALDRYSTPGIAFMGWQPVAKLSFLKFASRAAGGWIVQNVENSAAFTQAPTCSLVMDSSSKAHIGYVYTTAVFDAGHSYMYAVKYASNAKGSWQTSFIDNDPAKGFTNILFTMRNPAMAIDATGHPHVSYEAGYGNEYSYISYRVLKYATSLPPKYDATGRWVFTTSGNWFAGAAGCTGDRDGTVPGVLTQEGGTVVGIFDGTASNGYAGGSEYELYAKFPEPEGGMTKFLAYLSITSGTTASGTLLWFWDGDRPCYGGSRIDLTKIDGEVVPIVYPEPEPPASPISGFLPLLLLDE